jgi:hypothetical protein
MTTRITLGSRLSNECCENRHRHAIHPQRLDAAVLLFKGRRLIKIHFSIINNYFHGFRPQWTAGAFKPGGIVLAEIGQKELYTGFIVFQKRNIGPLVEYYEKFKDGW